jgi:formylmethanofuran dehydrogenase subunit C
LIRLQPAKEFRFPVIAECINPDLFQGKNVSEIGELKAWEGNKQRNLADLFKIEDLGDPQSSGPFEIVIEGDVNEVRRIGSKMKGGAITIRGNVGMHLGEEMVGGKIVVHGNVSAWAGSMMKNGTIEIRGNAGDYLAAPYRGSTKGMNGGRIVVDGNVGNEAGAYMKRGFIKVSGNAGQFVGLRMRDGDIHVQGDCDERVGACMADGRIIVGGRLQSVLPTFTVDGIRPKVKIDDNETIQGTFYLFLGDLAECGKGKLYVSKQKNPQLRSYERFL